MKIAPAPLGRPGWHRELKAILLLAAPLAAAQIAQVIMGTTDAIMMGRVGTASLAAGGLGTTVVLMLIVVAQGILQSIQPIVAQARGARDHSAFGRTLAGGFVLATVCALPIMLILVRIDRLLIWAGEPETLARLTLSYELGFVWGIPAALWQSVIRNHLQAMERTRIIMIVSGLACMINFGLNWTLIFGHLGFPALGLIGSGYATAIVWWGMGIALALYAWRQRLLPEDLFRLSGREVARGAGAVWQLGWPISAAWAVEVGLFSGASLLMGHFGEVALAAHQICLNLCSFTYMVPFSIGNAAAVRVGFHVGGGALRRARIAGFTAITLGISFMVLAALALLLASRQIFSLYLDASDPNLPAVVALGTKLLMVAALFQVFDGGQAVASGCLRGLKDTRAALVAETLGYWGVGMPTGIAFAFWAGWGPIGLWAGWVPALAAVALLLCLRFRHRTGRLIEDTRIGGALAEPA